MVFGDTVILLEHGRIEISVLDVGETYMRDVSVQFEVTYFRKCVGYHKIETFDSLKLAYDWYNMIDSSREWCNGNI